ncbi:MAG TPA: M48 family metallopeptidase [Candidatus Polarisedimenticolia bacterium]|nr:M48 family metallopeptidase [Candidatus Polarisedimenticolia bacterium]
MRHSSIFLSILSAVFLAGAACSTQQRVQTETSLAKALVTDEQSRQIGDEVHAELDAKGVRFVSDGAINAYVSRISGRIFSLAKKERSGIDYHVHVIDDPKTINAFATPGGHIYAYTGLLIAADNEAEVAGVLAHEAGHVVARHIERAMVNAYGLQALASMASGKNPSLTQQLATSIAATGVMRAHGRSEETEADTYGARYSSRAGYDPHAMITFFQKLADGERRTPGALAWLNTHPLAEDRIDNLNRYIREKGLTGTILNVAEHQEIKRRLVPTRAGA